MPTFIYRDSEARKPYEEPGDHHVTVEDFKFKYAAGSGNEMLQVMLRTDGGALVYDNLVFTEKAWWKIDHALKCLLPSKGKRPPSKDSPIEMNEDWAEENLRGATGWVTLSKEETPTGKMRNKVESYNPPKAGGKSAAARPATTKNPAAAAPTSAKPTTTNPEPDDDDIPF